MLQVEELMKLWDRNVGESKSYPSLVPTCVDPLGRIREEVCTWLSAPSPMQPL